MKWPSWVPFQRKAADPLAIWAEMLRAGSATKSGQTVNLQSAFRVAAFFACLRVISQGCAQVPFKLFREAEVDGLTKISAAKDHELYDLVTTQPNEFSTSFEFRETLVLHAAVGRAYVFINRGLGRRIRELILLDPSKVEVEQMEDYSLIYKVTGKSGDKRTFPAEAIWHVRGPSWNGYEGLDLLSLAREALGLSLSAEESHAKLHAKGVSPSGTYSVDSTLNAEQYKALKAWVIKENAGAEAGTPMILDRGAKWFSTSMSGLDAQHLETREHELREVCRFVGVNPIMVYANDKTTTYASAEQMFLAHVVHTMSAWYARIEQSADCHLLTKKERESGLYFKFMAGGLLRGAAKDRADYFSKALGAGGSPAWMTQDEVRALEEHNPMGGDASKLPVAMNVPTQPTADPAVKSQREEMHHATVQALKREAPPQPINLTFNQEPVNVKLDAPITVNTPEMKAAEAPKVQVDVHVPVPVVNVKNEVNNDITTPEPRVDITNNIQPAKVDVSVKASLPARKTNSSTEITRDAKGNIVKSKTVGSETDA